EDLYRLAKVVDSISISGSGIFTKIGGIMGTLYILAHEILRHRCSYLDVTDSTLEFDLTKAELLSGLLERSIEKKLFYFAARTNDGIARDTWAAIARDHVIVTEDKNGLSNNIIEVRHIAMTRRL
ncbi:hypothetical protein PRIPAC_73385, partial [Pristionchus pacificus]|uniref:Uncharacterized protein n=1 Tax=Pristionchus pacificus TaxID=54126 RepID=A0A2A6C7T7_PRIPA